VFALSHVGTPSARGRGRVPRSFHSIHRQIRQRTTPHPRVGNSSGATIRFRQDLQRRLRHFVQTGPENDTDRRTPCESRDCANKTRKGPGVQVCVGSRGSICLDPSSCLDLNLLKEALQSLVQIRATRGHGTQVRGENEHRGCNQQRQEPYHASQDSIPAAMPKGKWRTIGNLAQVRPPEGLRNRAPTVHI